MESNRKWYPTKAEWAAARAKECRDAAFRHGWKSSYGYKPRAQALSGARNRYYDEARKFDALEARFKAEGK